MGRLKLCFGIKADAEEWANALGIKHGDAKAKSCQFCLTTNPKGNNFCGNCGANLRQQVSDVGSADVIEILTRRGSPPSPVELLPGKNCIYLCQVLATSDGAFAASSKPVEVCPWKGIEKAIRDYAEMQQIKPYLFALDEERDK